MNDNETNIIALADRRPPVEYSITVTHEHDGAVQFTLHNVQTDRRSLLAVAEALDMMAELIREDLCGEPS